MTTANYEEYLGKTIYYLTILKIIPKQKGASFFVRCKCGKELIKHASRIITGHCKSCGCRSFPKLSKQKLIHPEIIPNQKYGKLVTLHSINKSKNKLDPKKKSQTWWVCKCQCGKIKEVRQNHIKYGNIISCGCYKIGAANPNWKGYEKISTRYYRGIKIGAKNRNISFNISIKQMWDQYIKQDKKCVLSGILLTFPTTTVSFDGNASLDRIDSSKGYEISNIQWIEKRLNKMKMDCSDEEFIKFCQIITNHQNKKASDLSSEAAIDYQI